MTSNLSTKWLQKKIPKSGLWCLIITHVAQPFGWKSDVGEPSSTKSGNLFPFESANPMETMLQVQHEIYYSVTWTQVFSVLHSVYVGENVPRKSAKQDNITHNENLLHRQTCGLYSPFPLFLFTSTLCNPPAALTQWDANPTNSWQSYCSMAKKNIDV